MSVDFYQLKLKINYNNSGNPYLQYGPVTGTSPPEEFQAGWTEVYDLPITNNIAVTASNSFNILAARASLLALNYYIFQAEIHTASVFKSALPLPGSAKYGGWDNTGAITAANPLTDAYAAQLCSNAEETVIIRQESSTLRRWERQLRGIKDYVSDDSMSYFTAVSYGPGTSTVFDQAAPAVQVPGTATGTAAVLDYTYAGGVLAFSGGGITSGGSYPWAVNGVYPLSITDPTGSGAYGTFTITGNTVSAVSMTSGGTGYTAPVVTAPVVADPGGIALYQAASTLWANFMSCMINYSGSGQHQRVANASFPSGYMTQLNDTAPLAGYYATSRCLLQRIGNRQTGQIRLVSAARRKRGI